jgi:hypothetical protein
MLFGAITLTNSAKQNPVYKCCCPTTVKVGSHTLSTLFGCLCIMQIQRTILTQGT